jgi:metal-responsive CopG/Arc/MetJ family transcriptional regulator
MGNSNKTKRMNIVLPERTIELIDDVWPQEGFRSRSAFLDEAARKYISRLKRSNIKRNLKAGYLIRAKRDLGMVNEWDVASAELLRDKTNIEAQK